MVFYVHAFIGLLIFGLLFTFFFTNRPQDNKFVSTKELLLIQREKSVAQIEQHKFVPYKVQFFDECYDECFQLIFLDLVVLTIWLNAFAELLATNFLSAYSPYYFRNVLRYSVEETGHFSAISRVTQVPFRILSGYASDNIR
jgi:sugar phosphate permease